MKQEETPETTRPKINSEELNELIKSPPDYLLRDNGRTIYFEGYDVEGEIDLDDELEIKENLIFDKCSFLSDEPFSIIGMICHGEVTFKFCNFSSDIYLINGTFNREFSFRYIESKKIFIWGGKYEKIRISGYTINKIEICGGRFQDIDIGGFPINGNIEKLTIRDRGYKLGNINVSRQNFTKINIGGLNSGNTYNFKGVKSNIVSISNFTNEGYLHFYSMEPRDSTNDTRYFQISNSNLGKTEFFRTQFSKYQEFIIIDSFITDSLFINCNWGKNIRAFHASDGALPSGSSVTNKEVPKIREAYRQLKISMSKHSDKIQEDKFYAEELNYYNKSLAWVWPWYNQFWDKLILYFSNWFSSYGQSFIKPLFWLLLGHFLFFSIPLLYGVFEPLGFSLINSSGEAFWLATEKYFEYINPFRSFDNSLSGGYFIIDILMRVWSSYMIYNIIRASRRFII
ncbi:hypothetical protein [Membranihabitans maritimus]|uniref:hypothetical protein n=1 Tax=Membranihabitans maritimus TaxID=2904244 RepID=UPI001F181F8B|nr:hypothetical protein [Membranihabitans maritimus]